MTIGNSQSTSKLAFGNNRPLKLLKIFFFSTLLLLLLSTFIERNHDIILVNEKFASAQNVIDITLTIVLTLFLTIQIRFDRKATDLLWPGSAIFCMGFFHVQSLFSDWIPNFIWGRTLATFFAGLFLNLPWLSPKLTRSKFMQGYPIKLFLALCIVTLIQISFSKYIPNTHGPNGDYTLAFKVLNTLSVILLSSGCISFFLRIRYQEQYEQWIRVLLFYLSFVALRRSMIFYSERQDLQWWILSIMRIGTDVIAIYYLLAVYNESLKSVQDTVKLLKQKNELLHLETQRTLDQQRLIEEQRALMFQSTQMASIAKLAGMIAHEINNPLNAISLYSEIILKKNQDSQQTLDRIKKIYSNTERIAQVVKRFVTLYRTQESLTFTDCNLVNIIKDTLNICQTTFANYGIQLLIDPVPEQNLRCRPSKVSQSLLNILLNSFDAVQKLNEKWVKVNFLETEKSIVIRVIDSGKGIPPEIEKNMMNPFFTTKDVNQGLGLGLTIAKSYIIEEGGLLYYDKNSANTCFVIELPKN